MATSASSGVDSETSFNIRAKAVGVDDAVLAKLHAANIRTMALAFVSSMQPGQQDEATIAALTTALDRAPTAAEMIPHRRFWFEASTVAVADFQQRLTREPSSEPSQLPFFLTEKKRDVLYSPPNIRSLNKMQGSINWRHKPLSSASARSSSHEGHEWASQSAPGGRKAIL